MKNDKAMDKVVDKGTNKMIDTAKMDVTQLKALAYDIFSFLEAKQIDLRRINDLIKAKERNSGKGMA